VLVLRVGLTGRHPFRTPLPTPEGGEILWPDAPFGRAHDEVAQCLGEAVGAQRRTQRRRPVVGAVGQVTGEQFA